MDFTSYVKAFRLYCIFAKVPSLFAFILPVESQYSSTSPVHQPSRWLHYTSIVRPMKQQYRNKPVGRSIFNSKHRCTRIGVAGTYPRSNLKDTGD
jgi:hypothetical protein